MKRLLAILCIMTLTVGMLAGCANKKTEGPVDEPNIDVVKTSNFDYGHIFDNNGFTRDYKTSDYVTELPKYAGLEIPEEVATVNEADIEAQLNEFMFYYGYVEQIKDRAVVEGDRVNIDFIGYVDGDPFEAGNTKEQGVTVVAGSNAYVEGFLTQLIGHYPGETFDIYVTMPANFEYSEVAGKDAVFKTTINYIEERSELTDEIVKEHLEEYRGWKTAEEALTAMRDETQKVQIRNYIADYLTDKAKELIDVEKLPEDYIKYFEDATVAFFTDQAGVLGISFESYISLYAQVDTKEALLEKFRENNIKEAQRTLLVQAIAEQEGIKLTDDEVLPYMTEINAGGEEKIEMFGMPYVKHILLYHKVVDFIYDNAILPSTTHHLAP